MPGRIILIGMLVNELRLVPVLILSFSAMVSGEPRDPTVAGVSEAHRLYLAREARRAVADVVSGRTVERAAYVPAALRALSVEAIVRLRESGYLRAAASAGPKPVREAVRDAALMAAEMMRSEQAMDPELLDRLLIEIEIVGRAEPIDAGPNWIVPRALDHLIEPGVHGLVVQAGSFHKRFAPSELFTNDLTLSAALEELAKTAGLETESLRNARLARFVTRHWYLPPRSDRVVSLTRGLTLVPRSAVSPRRLDAAISELAGYMRYRQLPSGLFTYQYEPGLDLYSRDQNLVRQVGAAAAMALHAGRYGDALSEACADLAIEYHRQGVAELPGIPGASFLATADGRNKLGVTALYAMALAWHPRASRYADLRESLVSGMLSRQRPSGMFVTSFPPSNEIGAQEYFPGEALLAMAYHYDASPSTRVLDAFDRGLRFYGEYFARQPSPAFVSWQAQAFSSMAMATKREDFARFVFEMADYLADKQLTPENCAWPELWGGVAGYGSTRAGVSTASYLEGFADALVLARSRGDGVRAARYEKVVSMAVRFVMQLMVREEEAYFIRSPRDAVGGVRTTLTLNLLRIDHSQHGLVGLIKARDALFPNER